MTAKEILNSAMALLGYTEQNGNCELPNRILLRAIPLINIIYSELKRAEGSGEIFPITDLCEEVRLSPDVLSEVMPCGVAMMIAGSESDGDSQSFWAEIYSRKKAILTRFEDRTDTIPYVEE